MAGFTRVWMGTILGLLLACGDDTSDFPTGAAGPPGGDAADGGAGDNFGRGGGSTAADASTSLPPEVEVELPFETPQAGRTSVYVPNPATHRVAIVNASSFVIETVASGLGPTYAATVPGEDVAVVLNVGSGDASILRTVNDRTSVVRLPIGHDQNAIAIAPDGAHAVVYFEARSTASGARSFQDISVLSLAAGKESVQGVSVGFRPQGVQFSRDGEQAFVVTEDGVSVIDLNATDKGPVIARLVPLGDTLFGAASLDVLVVADGSYALARREGDSSLRLIDLTSGAIQPLSLASLQAAPAPLPDAGTDAGVDAQVADAQIADAAIDPGRPLPAGPLELTDLDLSPDGTFALLVVRNASALLRIPIPAGFTNPALIDVQVIPDALVGSVVVSASGGVAALYTTAAPVEALVLVDLKQGTVPRTVKLRKTVRAVALSESGSHAFVLHNKSQAPFGADAEQMRIAGSDGYSLVDVARGFPKLQLTSAAIRERDLFVTPDASRVFALLRNDAQNVRDVHMADLTSFQVKVFALAKPPSSIGLVPDANRVFIGQESSGGMVTFLDSVSGEVVHAVSGFELSGRVRQ